jgi:uncharacterized protein YdhG (YjbR/CyaY superfamily)
LTATELKTGRFIDTLKKRAAVCFLAQSINLLIHHSMLKNRMSINPRSRLERFSRWLQSIRGQGKNTFSPAHKFTSNQPLAPTLKGQEAL